MKLNMTAILILTVPGIAAIMLTLTMGPALAAFPGTNGKIAFESKRDGNTEIYIMNSDGSSQTNLTYHPADDDDPAFSADGKQIAFVSLRDGNREIYRMNADGSNLTRLTNHSADDVQPAFSPDGTQIAFASTRGGNREIYVMNADGSNPIRITNNPATDRAPTFSPDGTKIAFRSNRDGNDEIYLMNADGSNQVNLTNHPAMDFSPAFSPDGMKIAFTATRDGNDEIYVMNTDGTGQTNITNSRLGDNYSSYSPDGTKITYRSARDGNREIYVMNADGSNQTRITNEPAEDLDPVWGQAVSLVPDLIFDDDFESGNLSAWSSSATDGDDLSVSLDMLTNNHRLQAVIDDNNAIYVIDDSPNAEPRYRARFHFDPNSILMANGENHYLFHAYSGTSTVVLRVQLRFSNKNYQIRASLRSDGSAWTNSSWFIISNASHSIELDWRAATASGANNGGLTLWIDGGDPKADLTGMDNDTRRIDRVRLGAVAGIDNGTRGTFYFDLFESRRQTYIGP